MDKISDHISYKEATYSPTAKAKGIKNEPSKDVLKRMKLVAVNIFEKVRTHFDKPIYVSSFFRSSALNVAIGGSKTSAHVNGEALDMDGDVYDSPSNKEIFEFIRDNLQFDQLIIEGISDGKMAWVHCSYKATGNRNQILFMYTNKGKKVYEPYSLARYKKLIN
jgi:hypothetical protein